MRNLPLPITFFLFLFHFFIITGQAQESSKPLGAPSVKDIDYTSGNVVQNQTLCAVDGFKATLHYTSEGVHRKATTRNLDAPTSTVGLGWGMMSNRIVRHHKGTGTVSDDSYYLNMDGSLHELLYIGQTDSIQTYRIESNPDWILRYFTFHDQWDLKRDNGLRYIYGDGLLNKGYEANSTETLVHWKNWIGNSALTDGQKQLSNSWHVSLKENIQGQKVRFHYQQTLEQVGQGGLNFTKACYLDKVIGYNGQSIVLSYKAKEPFEYVDPHSSLSIATDNDQDAYQERFEKKYLHQLTLYNFYGEVKYSVTLDYILLNKDQDQGQFAKRLLRSVSLKNPENGLIHPPHLFDYYGLDSLDGVKVASTSAATQFFNTESGALLGALKSNTNHTGRKHTYLYGKQTIQNSKREFDLIFPPPAPYDSNIEGYDIEAGCKTAWNAPELIFAGDFVIALYEPIALDYKRTHLQVYEWLGDKWELAVDEQLYGIFHDNYQAFDQYDAGVISKVKKAALKGIDEMQPAVMGSMMTALTDDISDQVHGVVQAADDFSRGEVGKGFKDFFMGVGTGLKDVVLDVASGFEKMWEKEKSWVTEMVGTPKQKYDQYQIDLFKKKNKFEAPDKNPRKKFHVTVQKDFFALLSPTYGTLYIFQKDPLVEGKWKRHLRTAKITSKFFQVESGDRFVAVLDELLDNVYIYHWDGLYWNNSATRLDMDDAQVSSSPTDDPVFKHAKYSSTISASNNVIIAVTKDSLLSQIKVSLIHHDADMNWKISKSPVNPNINLPEETKGIFNLLFGKNGKMVLESGNSFAALQTYNNLNPNLFFLDVSGIPLFGGLVNDLMPEDYKKINATFGITWDQNFENIKIQFLHSGWAQTDIGIQVKGDVINKVGKSASALITDNSIYPDNGKNYAFRYNGREFTSRQFKSTYYPSAFGADISSVVNTSDLGVDYKTPTFYRYDPNFPVTLTEDPEWFGKVHNALLGLRKISESHNPDAQRVEDHLKNVVLPAIASKITEGNVGWSEITAASGQNIPTKEELDEIIQVTADVIDLIVQIAFMVIPGVGEEMAMEEETMNALKTAEKATNAVSNAMMVLHPLANSLVDALIKADPYGTSILNNYIAVNGKLFSRNPNESWSEISERAFDDKDEDTYLIGTSNKVLPGFYPFTLKKGNDILNEVVLIKNGTLYKKIPLNGPEYKDMIVHGDSLSQVAGSGAFVSYGLLDDSKKGFIKPNEEREQYISAEERDSAAKRKRHASYQDATKVRLHRVIQDNVTGPLSDYVVKRIEVDDGFNSAYHQYLYESGQYFASAGNAIYGKVIDLTTPEPIPHLDTSNYKNLASAGYVERFFYNRDNYYSETIRKGYPGTEQLSALQKMVSYDSSYKKDSIPFSKSSIKPLHGHPYLNNTYDAEGNLVDQHLIAYKVWELDLDHFLKDTALSETQIYSVKIEKIANIRDKVVKISENVYDSLTMRLRSTINYTTAPSGESETTTRMTRYAFEDIPELRSRNRLTEVKNSVVYFQRGKGPIRFLSGEAIAYDSELLLPSVWYKAKLPDSLDVDINKDLSLIAEADILSQDLTRTAYETWLVDVETSLGDFKKAREAGIIHQQAADKSNRDLGTLNNELTQILATYQLAQDTLDYINKQLEERERSLKAAKDLLNEKKGSQVPDLQPYKNAKIKVIGEIEARKRERVALIASCSSGLVWFCVGIPFLDRYISDGERDLAFLDSVITAQDILAGEIAEQQGNVDEANDNLSGHKTKYKLWLEKEKALNRQIQNSTNSVADIQSKIINAAENWTNLVTDSEFALSHNGHEEIIKNKFHNRIQNGLTTFKDHHKEVQSKYGGLLDKVKSGTLLDSLDVVLPSISDTTFNKNIAIHQQHLNALHTSHGIVDSIRRAAWSIHKDTLVYAVSKWVEQKDISQFDPVKGIPISWTDTRNTPHSILLDKHHRNTIVHIENADINAGEALYYGFEEYENNPKKLKPKIVENKAHTGSRSLKGSCFKKIRFPAFKPKPEEYFSDSIYVLSAWVKKGRGWFGKKLCLKTADRKKKRIKLDKTNDWQYVEYIFHFSSDQDHPVSLKGGSKLYIDDILLRPLNSIVQTYTYNKQDQIATHTNNNALTTRFIYDVDHNQIGAVDDHHRVYHFSDLAYSRKGENHFDKKVPNAEINLHIQGKGFILEEKENAYTSTDVNPALSDFALYFNASESNSGNYQLSLNEQSTSYQSGNLFLNGQQILSNLDHPNRWIIIKSGGYLYWYGNGRLLAHHQINIDATSSQGMIHLSGTNLSGVMIGEEPVLDQRYSDGLAREVQWQHLDYDNQGTVKGKIISEKIYNGWGKLAAETLPIPEDDPALGYEPDLVTFMDWSNGQLLGKLSSYFARSDLPNLQKQDSSYCYHLSKFEASPISRKLRDILPGAFFHTKENNQQETKYQDTLGVLLAENLKVPKTVSGQFPNRVVIDAGKNQKIFLKDKKNRNIATKHGNSITKTLFDYNNKGFSQVKHRQPNFFEMNNSGMPDTWFTHELNNEDLLGIYQLNYDPDKGHLTRLKDHSGKPALFVRNNTGHFKENDPLPLVTIEYFKYDALGRAIEEGTNVRTFDVPFLENRINSGFWDDENVKAYRHWVYNIDQQGQTRNLKGRLSRSIHDQNTHRIIEDYSYTIHGEVQQVEQTIESLRSKTVKQSARFEYYPNGNLKLIIYPDGQKVLYTYDKMGRMQGVGSPSNAFAYAQYKYTIDSKVKEIIYNNNSIREEKQYDLQGHLSSMTYHQSDNSIHFRQAFTYNATPGNEPYLEGNIASISESGKHLPSDRSQKFTYDEQYRLTAVSETSSGVSGEYRYQYDANGNLLNIQEPSFKQAIEYDYEPGKNIRKNKAAINGLLTKINTPGSTTATIEYDLFTQMPIKVSGTDKQVSLWYDAENKRVVKTSSIDEQTDTIVYFHGHHPLPLSETKNGIKEGKAFVEKRNIVYGMDFGPICTVEDNQQVFYHLRDHQGSLKIVLDSNNVKVAGFDYKPFGAVLPHPENTGNYTYLYTGQEYDKDLGLHNYRARLYSPSERIFLSPDPLHEDASPYVYVGNNPINLVDPSGTGKENELEDMEEKELKPKKKMPQKRKAESNAAQGELSKGLGKSGGLRKKRRAAAAAAADSSPAKSEGQKMNLRKTADGKERKYTSHVSKRFENSRPSYAEGQEEEVWEAAKDDEGRVFDPHTEQELFWDKSKSRFYQWHMGHRPGFDYNRNQTKLMSGEMKEKDFLKEHRDPKNYWPENPHENMSRTHDEVEKKK